jgi:mono/diheme cytochrome c family protein
MSPRGWIAGLALAVVGAAALATFGAVATRAQTGSTPAPASPDQIARGQYLVRAADCAACHTVQGGKAFAGGRPFKLPFGTMYSTNITPDRDTGIGQWSDTDFVNALHHGVGPGGKHYYPSFPYTSFTGVSDADAVAMKAYLFSLAPAHAPAKPNNFPFPFNQRWGMIFWNAVFLKDHRFEPQPKLSEQQNRGMYLATALGHCGECHTPRNLGYGLKSHHQFAGAVLEGWHAWNLTSDKRSGVGAWSDHDLASYLNTGHADGHGSAAGPMGEAVEDSLQYLTPQDTTALVAYLRSVAPRQDKGDLVIAGAPAMLASTAYAPPASDGTPGLGHHIFEGACASCHQWDGKGQETPYAALGGGQTVSDPDGANITQAVLYGAHLHTAAGAAYMPAFGAAYTDQEVAAVTNYVIGHFGGKTGRVTPAMVKKARSDGG